MHVSSTSLLDCVISQAIYASKSSPERPQNLPNNISQNPPAPPPSYSYARPAIYGGIHPHNLPPPPPAHPQQRLPLGAHFAHQYHHHHPYHHLHHDHQSRLQQRSIEQLYEEEGGDDGAGLLLDEEEDDDDSRSRSSSISQLNDADSTHSVPMKSIHLNLSKRKRVNTLFKTGKYILLSHSRFWTSLRPSILFIFTLLKIKTSNVFLFLNQQHKLRLSHVRYAGTSLLAFTTASLPVKDARYVEKLIFVNYFVNLHNFF